MGDDNKAVEGAVISPEDLSGNDFLNDLMGENEPNIIKYMAMVNNKQYDLKPMVLMEKLEERSKT
jgi:tetrahydromethanopterin S-methyltransferase subunit H